MFLTQLVAELEIEFMSFLFQNPYDLRDMMMPLQQITLESNLLSERYLFKKNENCYLDFSAAMNLEKMGRPNM